MNIIKRFARWVLKADLEVLNVRIRMLHHDFMKRNRENDELKQQLNDWIIKTHLNVNSILPQSAVKSIIDCLPDPNDAAAGRLKIKKPDTYFSHVIRGKTVRHLVKIRKFYSIGDVTYVQVKIDSLNIAITLPLRKETIVYNMFGVNTEVETYYWDFNFSNIKIISDNSFDMFSEFIIAQRNVLTELQ